MIAVDTNILVYAHRSEMPQHDSALNVLASLGYADSGWAIPWPCIHEFLAVVTGRAFGTSATPVPLALETVETWTRHPGCQVIGETADHLSVLGALLQRARIGGGAVHDARIAAICLQHGVAELWSTDRDFNRFPDLRVRDPLIAGLHEPVRSYQAARSRRRK